MKPQHEKINYIELPSKDLALTRKFFSEVFGWNFTAHGDQYISFSDEGINGGFFQADLTASVKQGSALVIFYSDNLEQTQKKIEDAGGEITMEIFSFPGGKRFHFSDPNGNDYAVWSES